MKSSICIRAVAQVVMLYHRPSSYQEGEKREKKNEKEKTMISEIQCGV